MTDFSLVVYKLPSGIETSSEMASAGNVDGVESLASSEHGEQATAIVKGSGLATSASTNTVEVLVNENTQLIAELKEQNLALQKEVDQLKTLAERNAELEDRLGRLEAVLLEGGQLAKNKP